MTKEEQTMNDEIIVILDDAEFANLEAGNGGTFTYTPAAGEQTRELRKADLKADDLKAAGWKWSKGQTWRGQVSGETIPQARRMIEAGLKVGLVRGALVDGPRDTKPVVVGEPPIQQTQPPAHRLEAAIAKARGLAESLDAAAKDGERPREMNTPKRMAQAMHARLEAAVNRRAAGLLRAWANAPDRVPTWKPHKDDARKVVRRVLQDVPNGWHSYKVEGSEPYPYREPAILALRGAYPESLGNGQETPRARIERLEAAVRFSPIEGFFPTPPALIARVIELAEIQRGHRVLEPSAGCGHLAEAARELGAWVDCCEIAPRLREILDARGFELVGHDCLEFARELAVPTYRRVIMNPPFERGQDREHIRAMFGLLQPGGRMVAVCSTGPLQRQAKADAEFREWLAEVGAEIEDVGHGAFAGPDAFRQTGVAVAIITIDKEG